MLSQPQRRSIRGGAQDASTPQQVT